MNNFSNVNSNLNSNTNSNSKSIISNPHLRLRRLRQSAAIRALAQENQINKQDLIYPIFITAEGTSPTDIAGLPGIQRIPFQNLNKEIDEILEVGLRAIMIFPVIESSKKDPTAKEAFNKNGLMQNCIRKIKSAYPELLVGIDVALDPFTSHGHDGFVDEKGNILNDETVQALCQMSLSYAECGVDYVCPSDMMDGRIGAIRSTLDEAGHIHTGIMAYSVKYASAFYGPFREAVGSGSHKLDKRTYQVNPANSREALREVLCDVEEGADIVIIKPGLPYLDIIAESRKNIQNPIATYQVSGEYAMIKFASQQGVIDEERAVHETFLSMKRAGADIIISYYAKWACQKFL